MSQIARGIRAFGRFWWDFLVGDTPELFVGMLVIVGASFALHAHRVFAVVLVPGIAIVVLVTSTIRGRRRA